MTGLEKTVRRGIRQHTETWWRWQFNLRDKKVKSLGFSSYFDYRYSDGYRARKQQVLDRAEDVCEACEERNELQVHHLHYQTIGKERSADLLALCDECHMFAGEYLPEPPPTLREPNQLASVGG